jgi:hypothetical protein
MISRTEIIEALSAEMHNAWMEANRANGVTTAISRLTGEEQMVPYDDLSDVVKEYDRAGAHAFLDTIARLGFEIAPQGTSDALAEALTFLSERR